MTNLIFLGISPTTKVGQNNTSKADVALLNKETFDYKGEKRTRFNLIVATAWSGMIDRFNGCEVGDIIPNLELKGDSRIHQGKVYSSHTVISVDNTWMKKPLTPETNAEVTKYSAEFKTTYDGTAKTYDPGRYQAPTNTAKTPAPALDDDLPF